MKVNRKAVRRVLRDRNLSPPYAKHKGQNKVQKYVPSHGT
jgi:hypothetical protein